MPRHFYLSLFDFRINTPVKQGQIKMSRQISTPQEAVQLSGQHLSTIQNSYINLFFRVFFDSVSLKSSSKNLLPLVEGSAERYLPPHDVRYQNDIEI